MQEYGNENRQPTSRALCNPPPLRPLVDTSCHLPPVLLCQWLADLLPSRDPWHSGRWYRRRWPGFRSHVARTKPNVTHSRMFREARWCQLEKVGDANRAPRTEAWVFLSLRGRTLLTERAPIRSMGGSRTSSSRLPRSADCPGLRLRHLVGAWSSLDEPLSVARNDGGRRTRCSDPRYDRHHCPALGS